MSTADRPSRRAFLRGRAAVDALAAAVGQHHDDAQSTDPTGLPAQALVSYTRRAMACDFEVQLAAGRHDGSTERVLAALDLLEPLEDQMTVYRSDSELLQINRAAATAPVTVEPRLFALLELAAQIHADTQGAFDATSLPLSEAWGFSRRQGRLPGDAEIAAALERVGMGDVVLDAANQSVAFRRAGLSLHLNSIGKGYALDRMAESLDEAACETGERVGDYLLHGGRSSVLARGTRPGAANSGQGPGWPIGIPNPLVPGERLGEIVLVDEALGTSGSGTQFFEQGGRRYGHLMDPRTGRPAEGIYSATVIAPSAAEADALSTAFYVMEIDETAAYCAAHPAIAAILVTVSNAADGIPERDLLVSTFGLDPRRWHPAISA